MVELQGEEAADLGVVGRERAQHLGQPDRLVGEVDAHHGRCRLRIRRRRLAMGEVSLVEDQVEREAQGAHPLVDPFRDAERDPGGPDLPLRPHDALRERRLRDQRTGGDLGRGEARDEAQDERDLGVAIQRRVRAQEHETQRLVPDVGMFHDRHLLGRSGRECELRRRLSEPAVDGGGPAESVDRTVARDGVQPRRRITRDALRRPDLHRLEERILHAVVGDVEVAEPDREEGGDTSALLAGQPGDGVIDLGGCHCRRAEICHVTPVQRALPTGCGVPDASGAIASGRISTDPTKGMARTRSRAPSRSSTRTT